MRHIRGYYVILALALGLWSLAVIGGVFVEHWIAGVSAA